MSCYILWRTFCARSRGCVFESVHRALIRPTTPCVLTTLFCLRRLREAVVLRVKEWVFFNFICILKLLVIFLWVTMKFRSKCYHCNRYVVSLCGGSLSVSGTPLWPWGLCFLTQLIYGLFKQVIILFVGWEIFRINLYILIVMYKLQNCTCIYSINHIFKYWINKTKNSSVSDGNSNIVLYYCR